MEKPSPAVLGVITALALPLTPGCTREVDGIRIEISTVAQRALETEVIMGCNVENTRWQPAQSHIFQSGTAGVFGTPIYNDRTTQALLIPHPDLATISCLEEVENNWSDIGTHCTLRLERDDSSNHLMIATCP